MLGNHMLPFLVLVSLFSIAVFLDVSLCEHSWESSILTTRQYDNANTECLEWCRRAYGVSTYSVDYSSASNEDGFSFYICLCDRKDCANIFRHMPG